MPDPATCVQSIAFWWWLTSMPGRLLGGGAGALRGSTLWFRASWGLACAAGAVESEPQTSASVARTPVIARAARSQCRGFNPVARASHMFVT